MNVESIAGGNGTRLILLGLLASLSLAAADRVMVGDSIYVGKNEEIDSAVCIGCSIHIEGKVRDAVAIGGSIRIDGGQVNDAVAIGGGIDVRGGIEGDVVAIGGGLRLDGDAKGDAVAIFGDIEITDSSRLEGSAVAIFGGVRAPAGAIGGDIVQHAEGLRSLALSGLVIFLVLLVAAGLAFFPLISFICYAIMGERRVAMIAETLGQRAGMCFLIGAGVWVSLTLASIFLPVILFWVPVGGGLAPLAFFVIAAVGYTGLSLVVGRGLSRSATTGGAVVLGALLIALVQAIPIIGWLAWIVFGLMSLGAAVLSGFGTSIDWLMRRSEGDPIARPAIH